MPSLSKPVVCSTTAFLCLFFGIAVLSNIHADEDSKSKRLAMVPVEADMHEFMEYAFEPVFKDLKAALAEAPKDKKGWVPVKAGALILAENGNLLMMRGPDESRQEWEQLAAEMRDQGKELYAAAKKRDFPTSRKQYESFVAKCNACHEQFADGKHIQKP